MLRRLILKMNLRRKLIIGFFICLAAMGGIAAMSYYNLHRIEQKVQVVEMTDDLSNTILEMRRYEKNYLLYGHGYDENMRYVHSAMEKLTDIEANSHLLVIADSLNRLRELLTQYRERMSELQAMAADRQNKKTIEALRTHGQELEEISRQVVHYERRRINEINTKLKRSLFISMGLLLLLGLGLIYFLNVLIIKPLREVEAITVKISEGNFEPVSLPGGEDEIRRIVSALNRMVMELDRRRDQLVQNMKLSSIGTLASGIAHQLNNPLNNISTSCQILMEEDTPAPEFSDKMLRNIERETFRARDIVRGLLEFSRKQEFHMRQENLAEVLKSALRLVSSQIPPDVPVDTLVPEHIELDMDRQQMQELFLNLIQNAVQALDGADKGLSVTAEEDLVRDKVSILVEDEGQGLSEEVRNQIFDPFFTTKDVGAGTGLGLYIVYNIVRKHGGEICVEGRPGIGARFVITLPRRAVKADKEEE